MTLALEEYPDRFVDKVEMSPATGCWLWTGAKSGEGARPGWEGGYPYIRIGDRVVGAHRYAVEYALGVGLGGMDVHHTCGTRACVNPAHLEPVERTRHMELTPGLRGWS